MSADRTAADATTGRGLSSPVNGRRYQAGPETCHSLVGAFRWMAAASAALASMPSTGEARERPGKTATSPLELMTFAEANAAGVVGAGCTWLGLHDRAGRLFMTDDRAAIRRDGSILVLRPAMDARPLFLTYDRWIGGGIDVRVLDSGRIVSSAGESSKTVAAIEVTVDGLKRTWQGRLDCGS